MTHKHLTDVLIKPAGPDCNLACEYCFYTSKQALFSGSHTRMRDDVLESLIAQLLAQPIQHLSIGWQGGEPTLMGIPFFRNALNLMEKYGKGKIIANGLQTNGLLIDKNWAKLFRDYHFLIGLSLDGPQHIHDHYRKNRNGQGSWQKTVNAAKLMLEQGVQVNALTVVNQYSVQFPEEIYAFHKSLGLNFMQFIPCVEIDTHNPTSVTPFSVSAVEYGEFLCKLFDLWLADFSNDLPQTSIRFFEALLFKYAGFAPTECTLANECGGYVVVEHTGDVYACDFFVEPDWNLGNLVETPIVSLFNSAKQSEFGQLKADLHETCENCNWYELCQGGCVKDRFRNPSELNHLCHAYQVFFSHADKHFRHMTEEWKRKQGQ